MKTMKTRLVASSPNEEGLAERIAPAPSEWLLGGGEMAKVITAKDWSDSPLGAIESWPQSLRTIVSLTQASKSPMSVAWGPGHVQIYNDGYWPVCGVKHPTSMGQDFRKCWASAFPVIGDAYASAWAGKSAYLEKMRMFLDRNGFLEETWFTFSFSPVTDESGKVGGVFHPVTEMTAQMLYERRAKILRDLAGCAAKARTRHEASVLCTQVLVEAALDLPFILLYALDSNSGLATLVGSTGVTAPSLHCPAVVDTRATEELPWDLGHVARTGIARQLDDVVARLADVTVGPYPESPRIAFVLPVMQPGSDLPAALMVAGLSSRLPVNDSSRDFCVLVAGGIATVLAGARAYEDEHQKAESLAHLDKSRTAFFSNVSHELRTPLTLILGPVENALAQGSLGGDDLEAVHRSALRLLRLVNSVLDFSRLEAGLLQPSFVATDLPVLTTLLASSFQPLISAARLNLVVDCPPLTEPVYVDRAHWETIVLNLVSNAFKFTLEGDITVRLRCVDGAVELTVADTGTGIAPDELPKVFERFYRVAGSRGRTFDGTGIGLSLVRELVSAHNGVVRVESIVGRGTTFTVSIPRGSRHLRKDRVVIEHDTSLTAPKLYPAVAEAAQWITATPPPERSEGVVDGERQRVLVADDNADMREYLARLLSPHWNVELVDDGQAAFDAAIARRPDLILSDVMMPGMDGVTLLRAVRGDRRLATTPVVLLSARAGEEAIMEGIETLADDYLVKPFSARELVTRVRTHLRMARIRQSFQARLIIADRMAAVGALAAGIAHEINNPLSYVSSNLELLAGEIRDHLGDSSSRAVALKEMLYDARQGAERIQKIVRGMKTFSRSDEHRLAPLDVHPLLELSIDMTFNEIRHRAHLVKDFGAIPLVNANEALLGQVFVNLLVNAAHAIPEGHTKNNEIRLVTTTDASGRAVIEVRDTGRGIPPDILTHVFDPFFTTKPIGQGTGLGLSICHSIVQGLDGEITVDSELGKGSVFRITLPAARVERPAPVDVTSTAGSAPTRRGRVLVVDDDIKVGEVLQRILGKEHEVTVLSSGQAALDLLLAGDHFDVILCDLMMPHLTGMDIFAALSGARPEVGARIVFVTGGAFTSDTRHFLDTIPNQRLEKPFSPQNLRAMVRCFVQGAPAPATVPAGEAAEIVLRPVVAHGTTRPH